MLKQYNISFILFLLLIAGTGCKKYLDEKSDSSLVVPNTLQDLQGMLDDEPIMNENTPSFGEASADDYYLRPQVYSNQNSHFQNIYKWNFPPYEFQNDWSYAYAAIYNANLSLEIVETIDSTSQNHAAWKNVKGSALFYRAFHFLNLAWTFSKAYDPTTYNSDPGIVLRLQTDFNVPSVRSTVKETYDRIIIDAKTAVGYLPDHPQHRTRPSKAAAYALLARAYLSMRDYENAFIYADLSLSLKNDLLDYNNINITALAPFAPFNPEVIFHSIMGPTVNIHSVGRGSIDTILYQRYAANDLRKEAYFFAFNGQTYTGTYSGSLNKFFTGLATDEIYLIRAEASARRGNKDAAMDDLNNLLVNRYDDTSPFVPLTATDATDALNKILTERRKALLMRGLRWMDVKRLNKEGANIILKRVVEGQTIILPPNDNRYALPLPDDIIRNSSIEQNPG